MRFSSEQLATLGLYSSTAGLVTGVIGSFLSSSSQKSQLKEQAKIAEINARMSELEAQSALAQGNDRVAQITMSAGQLKSSQRARLAANGADLGVGSAAELQASTDIMKDLDKNAATTNAINRAFGYRTQAVNYQNEALMKKSSAKSINPYVNSFNTLLGGAARVAPHWLRYSQSANPIQEQVKGDYIWSGLDESMGLTGW